MNMGGNTSLPILPMPPQAHDDAIRSLNELLWDVSHENTLEQGHISLSNIASPQLPDVLVPGLTDDILDIDSNPNQVVAPPIIPHQPIEPTFRFPASTLPPNLESPGESSSCMPHNQTLCAVEAPSIALVGTGGEKCAYKPTILCMQRDTSAINTTFARRAQLRRHLRDLRVL
jgi:hypothetical protein